MYKTTIRIYGKVQNVGLRVKIKDVADALGVNGTVENLRDGSVTVVCEAEEATVRKMLDQIRKSSKMATIRDIQTEHSPVTGMEGFQIVYKDTTIELINVVRAGTTTLQGISIKLDDMSATMTDMSETLGRVENKLDTMDDKLGNMDQKLGNMDQKLGNIEDTQYQTLRTQKDTCSAIESIDSKMNLSLENDKEILKIIKPAR